MLYAHASIKVRRRPTRRGKSCLRNVFRVQSGSRKKKSALGESGNVRTGKSEWSEVNHAKKSLIMKACERVGFLTAAVSVCVDF